MKEEVKRCPKCGGELTYMPRAIDDDCHEGHCQIRFVWFCFNCMEIIKEEEGK